MRTLRSGFDEPQPETIIIILIIDIITTNIVITIIIHLIIITETGAAGRRRGSGRSVKLRRGSNPFDLLIRFEHVRQPMALNVDSTDTRTRQDAKATPRSKSSKVAKRVLSHALWQCKRAKRSKVANKQ